MAQWEYLVRVFALDKDDEVVINFIQMEYPERDWKDLPPVVRWPLSQG